MKVRSALSVLLLLCPLVNSHAQAWSGILDTTRATNWQRSAVGVPGGIPSANWTQCGPTIAAYRGDASAINSQIGGCSDHQYVLLGPGTFNLTSSIKYNRSNVVVRGSGPMQTTVVFTAAFSDSACDLGSNAGFCLQPAKFTMSDSPNVQPPCLSNTNCADWIAGYAQGATSITVADVGTVGVLNGDEIILDQQNDITDNGGFIVCDDNTNFICHDDTTPVVGGQIGREIGGRFYSQQQYVLVTAGCATPCVGSGPFTLTISPGLYANNWNGGGRTTGVWFTKPAVNNGVENLSIDASAVPRTFRNNIAFINCRGCWVRNVRSYQARSAHVVAVSSARDEVRDSYFFGTLNAATESYGIETYPAGDSLIENNILQQIVSPILLGGGQGNVVGYNFSINTLIGSGSDVMQFSYDYHDPGNLFSLFEGNLFPGISCDQIWGTGGLSTLYRNWLNGRDYDGSILTEYQTFPVDFESYCRGMNVIGNVLGTPGYHTAANGGNYEMYPPNSYTPLSCDHGIYSLGWGAGICSTGVNVGVLDDPLVRNTLMRWGNYDTVTGQVRWDSGESAPNAVTYINANPAPASHVLPPSFYLAQEPMFFGSNPYPPVGPDVSGGPGPGGFAYRNPAAVCYYTNMGGPVDGTGPFLNFDADTCYGSAAQNGSCASGTPSLARTQSCTLTVDSRSRELLIFAAGGSAWASISGVTVGTQSAIPVISQNSSQEEIEIWQLSNPPIGTQTVTVTWTSSVINTAMAAITFNGTITSRVSASGGASPAMLLVPSVPGDIVADGLVQDEGLCSTATAVPGAGQTVQFNYCRDNQMRMAVSTKPGDTLVPMQWNLTTTWVGPPWAEVAVNLHSGPTQDASCASGMPSLANTQSCTMTISPGTKQIVIFGAGGSPWASITRVTVGAANATLLKVQKSSQEEIEAWTLSNPPSGQQTVTVSWSSSVINTAMAAISFIGGSGAVSTVSASGNASPATLSLASGLGDIVIDGLVQDEGFCSSATATPEASQILQFNYCRDTQMRMALSTKPGDNTVNMAWGLTTTWSGPPWAEIAVNIH